MAVSAPSFEAESRAPMHQSVAQHVKQRLAEARGPSAQTRHGGGNRASVTDLELEKKVDRVYLMSFNPEAACASP